VSPSNSAIDTVRAGGDALWQARLQARGAWFAGHDTLVRIRNLPGTGPICVGAITWDRSKRVVVKLSWSLG
jgi:hypothetical protein